MRQARIRFSDLIVQNRHLKLVAPPDELHREAVLSKFEVLPESAQERVVDDFERSCRLWTKLKAHHNLMTREKEIRVLREFLNLAGLESPSDDILDLIDEGDIIEVYRPDGIQVYRSWSCFEVISYSLAELLTHPYYELCDRPSSILAKTVELIALAMVPETPVISFKEHGILPYIMSECLEGHNNQIEFDQKYLLALKDKSSGGPSALLATGAARKTDGAGTNLRYI